MKLRGIRLAYNVPGIGTFDEVVCTNVTLHAVLGGLRNLDCNNWPRLLVQANTAKDTLLQCPVEFTGWLVGNGEKPQKLVVFQSFELLANAINAGQLVPAPPACKTALQLWGPVVNTKTNRSSASLLRQNTAALRSIGLFPASKIKTPNTFELLQAGKEKGFYLIQRVPVEPWQGMLQVISVPVAVQVGGTTVNRCRWLAQPCQATKYMKDRPLPLMYFDGIRYRRVAKADLLPAEVYSDFENHAAVAVVPQSCLVPPKTMAARWVFSLPEDKDDKNAEPEEYSIKPRATMSFSNMDVVPSFAGVRLAPGLRRLDENNAQQASEILYKTWPHWQQELPKELRRSDFFLCGRSLPLAREPEAVVARQHEFNLDHSGVVPAGIPEVRVEPPAEDEDKCLPF